MIVIDYDVNISKPQETYHETGWETYRRNTTTRMVWLIFRERNKGLAYYTMGDAIPFEEGGIYIITYRDSSTDRSKK